MAIEGHTPFELRLLMIEILHGAICTMLPATITPRGFGISSHAGILSSTDCSTQ